MAYLEASDLEQEMLKIF